MENNIKTLADALNIAATSAADKIAYAYLENNEIVSSITYKQLWQTANALADALAKKLGTGERILLLFAPGIDFIKAFLGVVLSGNIAVPIYPPQTEDAALQLQNIIEDCHPKLCLTTNSILQRIKRLGTIKKIVKIPGMRFLLQKKMTPQQKHMLAASRLKLESLNWLTLEKIFINADEHFPARHIKAHDVAYLQYTSGSTGTPKGVVITHENLIHNIGVNHYQAEVTEQDISLSWVPNYHNIGLVVGILSPLCSRSTAYLMSPLEVLKNPLNWLAAISRYRVSISGGPNFIYQQCSQDIPAEALAQLDLSCWAIAFCGGEQIHIETMNTFSEYFAKAGFHANAIYPAYGLAEATVYVMGSYRARGLLKVGINESAYQKNQIVLADSSKHKWLVAGRVDAPNHEVIIVDPVTKQKLTERQVGEIWLKSHSVAKGYWQRPEESRAVFAAQLATGEGPYLRTGDLGFMHDQVLVVSGRHKELIIIRGHNYYPFDIESCLENMITAIAPGSVIAFSVPLRQEEVLIILIEETAALDSSLFSLIRKELAKQLGVTPYHICFLAKESIAKTPSAKKKRLTMRQRYLENTLNILREWREDENNLAKEHTHALIDKNREEEVKYFILNWLSHRLGVAVNEINPEKNLSSYGLDSLAMMNFLNALEKQFVIPPINPVILYEYNTIKALIQYLVSLPKPTLEQASVKIASDEPIAIIGMACRMPGANSLDAFWELLISGKHAIREVTEQRQALGLHFDKNDPLYPMVSRIGLIDDVDGFDNHFFNIPTNESQFICPQQRLLLECSWHALEHAGIKPATLSGSDTSIFIGMSTCDYRTLLDENAKEASSVYVSTGTTLSAAAGRLAYFYNTQGKAIVVDTACSSSLVAIDSAIQELKANRTRMAIVGSANLILTPHNSLHFAKAKMLARDGLCKTFDSSADGYVRGEGVGVVILKRLSDATKDGDTILGVIRGSLVNQDGFSNGLTAPNAQSQVKLLQETLQKSHLSLDNIDYFEVHGTGTVLGDPIEINSIAKVYHHRKNPLYVGSVKTVIGHLEAAAGMASLIKVLLSFQARQLPPHLNVNVLNPYLELDTIPAKLVTQVMAWPNENAIMRAAINSFGFTGTNAHLLLESYPQHSDYRNNQVLYPFHHESRWFNTIIKPLAETPALDWHSLESSIRLLKITNILKQELQNFLATDQVATLSDQQGFMELGLDSMQLIELSDVVQKKLGIEIDPYELFEYKNIQQLANYLNQFFQTKSTAVPVMTQPEVKPSQEVAIIGMGCRFPGGIDNPDKLWHALQMGVDALDQPVQERTAYHDDLGGYLERVEYFDAKHFGISPREAVCIDPQQRILLEVVWEALWNSGIAPETLKNSKTGVFIGISSNDYNQCLRQSSLSPALHLSTGNSLSVASGRISYLLGLKGPSLSLDTACSSSLVATHVACQSIKNGECDLAIVAGVNLILEPAHSDNLKAANMLSPEGRCKSFDAHANGFVRSEGCGVVILANKPSLKALALIKGSAVNQDGHSSGLTAPNSEAQQEVIRLALKNAGMKGEDIDYLEAHGSGTALGDPIELNAIKKTYTPRSKPLKIGSIKASIGHAEAASGVAGLIKTVLALQHQQLPAQINFVEKNPQIKLQLGEAEILTSLTPWQRGARKRLAGVSSFGFSGTNCHLIVSEVEHHTLLMTYQPYPFVREYYWCDPKPVEKSQFTFVRHPILNKRLLLADHSVLYVGEVSLVKFPYLMAHNIFSYVLFPGAAFCELMLTVAKEEFQSHDVTLNEIKFLEALVLTENSAHELQVMVNRSGAILSIEVFSKKIGETNWISYCKARCEKSTVSAQLKDWNEKSLSEVYPADDFYRVMNGNDIFYGDAFKVIKTIRYANNLVAVEIEINQNATDYIVHPTLLDGCFQSAVTLSVISGNANQKEAYIPFSIESITVAQAFPKRVKVLADVKRQSTAETMACDLWIVDEASIPVACIKGLIGRRASMDAIKRQLASKKQFTYQVHWQAEKLSTETVNDLGVTAILTDMNDELTQLFARQSHAFHRHTFTDYVSIIQNQQSSLSNTLIMIDDELALNSSQAILNRINMLRIILQLSLQKEAKLPAIIYLCHHQQGDVLAQHSPAFHAVGSFIRSLSLEHPKLKYLISRLNLNDAKNSDYLWQELTSLKNENVIYQQHQRYVARLKPALLNSPTTAMSVDGKGAYLITGGMGALGQQTVNWLIEKGAKYFILLGKNIRETNEICSHDPTVIIYKQALDVTNTKEVAALIQSFNTQHPPLKGVIHAAGMLQDTLFNNLTEQQLTLVWQAKVAGFVNLDEAIQQAKIKLDFFVAFSSLAAVLGSPGQSHYAAANAMMDALVLIRHTQGQPYISVNWGPWEGAGMASAWVSQHQRVGITALSTADHFALLERSVANQIDTVTATQIDFAEYLKYFKGNESLLTLLKPVAKVQTAWLTQTISQSPAKRHLKIVTEFVKQQLQQVLNAEASAPFSMDVGFFDMGLDSLMLLELQERLQNGIGDVFELANTVGFDHPTPALLAEKIYQLYAKTKEPEKASVTSQAEKSLSELIKMIDDD